MEPLASQLVNEIHTTSFIILFTVQTLSFHPRTLLDRYFSLPSPPVDFLFFLLICLSNRGISPIRSTLLITFVPVWICYLISFFCFVLCSGLVVIVRYGTWIVLRLLISCFWLTRIWMSGSKRECGRFVYVLVSVYVTVNLIVCGCECRWRCG